MSPSRALLLGLLLVLAPCAVDAADLAAGPSATGNGSGSDWNNVLNFNTSGLGRGNTYWLRNGSYSRSEFNTPSSGSTAIVIRKATDLAHGPAAGWQSAFAGPATFGTIAFRTSNWIFDGATRNESDWSQQVYGFRVVSIEQKSIDPEGAGSNLTFQYVDAGRPVGSGPVNDPVDPTVCFRLFGQSNVTISRFYCHNVGVSIQILNVDGLTIERGYMGPGWQKETIRGQSFVTNTVIRWNRMINSCQSVSGDPPDGRVSCTAQIAIWGATGNPGSAGAFDNISIYGNIIFTNAGTPHTDAAIMLGGDGGLTAEGPPARFAMVFNNTISGISDGRSNIRLNGSSQGSVCRNNLWFQTVGTPGTTGCPSESNNLRATVNPFLNFAGLDFRLVAAIAGVSSGSPAGNATDMGGVARGSDGTWDIGAMEFGGTGGGTFSPSAPSSLTLSRGPVDTSTWVAALYGPDTMAGPFDDAHRAWPRDLRVGLLHPRIPELPARKREDRVS